MIVAYAFVCFSTCKCDCTFIYVVAANARGLSSATKLLRYPLRSGIKPKEEKPPLTDSSNSSVPRRFVSIDVTPSPIFSV